MVESIIAINIVVIGLLGVLGLLSRSLALNRDVGQKLVGTYLASEGGEIVKGLIDANYVEGRASNDRLADGDYNASYDSDSLAAASEDYLRLYDGIYGYTGGEATFFKRNIHIEDLSSGEEIKVVSTVKWETKKGLQRIDIENHFFNWR